MEEGGSLLRPAERARCPLGAQRTPWAGERGRTATASRVSNRRLATLLPCVPEDTPHDGHLNEASGIAEGEGRGVRPTSCPGACWGAEPRRTPAEGAPFPASLRAGARGAGCSRGVPRPEHGLRGRAGQRPPAGPHTATEKHVGEAGLRLRSSPAPAPQDGRRPEETA